MIQLKNVTGKIMKCQKPAVMFSFFFLYPRAHLKRIRKNGSIFGCQRVFTLTFANLHVVKNKIRSSKFVFFVNQKSEKIEKKN